MIHFITPFRLDKNLGKAYNDSISLLPDSDHICLLDYDVCFLSPNSIPIIYEYVEKYPDAVLTCWQSRGHELAAQTIGGETFDLKRLKEIAVELEGRDTTVIKIEKHLSGFCLVFPKSLWVEFPFIENGGCLGVDTDFMKRLQAAGKKVYLMDRVLCLHAYRLNDKQDKSHLI